MPMPTKMPMDTKAEGFSMAKVNRGGIKKYHTNTVESTVAKKPPRRPPIQELKNTAG